MQSKKIIHFSSSFAALFLAVFMIGTVNQSIVIPEKSTIFELNVVSTIPSDGEVDVARNTVIEITFSEEMDSTTINNSTFTLVQGTDSVAGSLEYSGNKATFTTTSNLKAESVYTVNITTANNLADGEYSDNEFNDEEYEESNAANNGKEWSFTTGGNTNPAETVDLGSAAEYVILAQSSIQNDSTSQITGEKGFDPDAKVTKDKDNKTAYWLNNGDLDKEELRRDKEVARSESTRRTDENRDYSANDTISYSNNMDKAVEDMMTAYTKAEERLPIDFNNYKLIHSDGQSESTRKDDRDDNNEMDSTESGLEVHYNAEQRMSERTNDSSITLEPGIYKWNEPVIISTNITLSGNAEDVWIFQIPEGLTVKRDIEINLSGGAVAEHVFWQVAGEVNLEEFSHFEGIILSLTGITMKNGATLNGRMLAQTDVILNDNTIIEPQLLTSVQPTSSNE